MPADDTAGVVGVTGPHQGEQTVTAGTSLDGASAAVVLVHGRGATARGMLGMATELPDGVAYLAPQAARRTWYPNSFLEPVDRNEPGRSSGLARLDELVERAGNAGLDPGRVVLVGFSQGGCLASDFLAGNPRRYGGLAALSGGLIGESVGRDSYDGSLSGTPVFLGCSDTDPHIPAERVRETATVFDELGADVDVRLYEGMGHTVNADELAAVSGLIERTRKR
jgi:phospholipase/carboxylesterase